MIMTTTERLPNTEVEEVLGVVRGSTIRAKHIGKDILAGLRSLVGGEIKEYVEAINDAREEATARMVKEAETLGADAIVNIRFATSQVMPGAAELMVYGTAVRLQK